jgi:hypothetical protein
LHLAEWEAAGEASVQGYDGLKLLTYEFIILVSGNWLQWLALQLLHPLCKVMGSSC